MNLIKKLILFSIITITTFICAGFCSEFTTSTTSITYFPFSGTDVPGGLTGIDVDFTPMITDSMQEDTDGIVRKLLNLFMPNSTIYGSEDSPSFLFYLKTIVNLLLSFVSLIALILILYAFYMIFFKKDEAGITTAKQIIKGVVIALFVIGLSRIIVSFLFRFEKENTQNVGYNDTQIESLIG